MLNERDKSRFAIRAAERQETKDLTYGDLIRTLEHAQEVYGTYEGLTLLLNKRQDAIDKLMEVAGDKIRGILSTGYPNYALPEISLPDASTKLTKESFTAVAEIQRYLQEKIDRLKAEDPQEKWPCLGCRAAVGGDSLRSRDHGCVSPITPLTLLSALPDIDLYIVVDDLEDAREIIRSYEAAGLNVAENQMRSSVENFPDVLSIDPQFVLKKDFTQALEKIATGTGDWRKIPLPLLLHHGKIETKQINHLGLDFAFSMISHTIPDAELEAAFHQARAAFVENRTVEDITAEIKNTSTSTDLPPRIGRLVKDHTDLEMRLKTRLGAFAS